MGEKMNSMEILDKVENLRQQKGLTVYRLMKDAGISHNTLNAWRKRQTMPSFYVLEAICDALNVSMAVLFIDDIRLDELSNETKKMLSIWETLSAVKKRAVLSFLTTLQQLD